MKSKKCTKLLTDSIKQTAESHMSKARKKWLKATPLVMCGMMGAMLFGASDASAHGYIENSRAHQGKLAANLNWTSAFEKYGRAVNEPQSIEAKKGFPLAGPVDGKLASGGLNDFSLLDIQTDNYWKKTNIQSGKNTFIWNYTAEHTTTKWTYYITKKGWDSNKPLTRDVLEEIGTIDGEGKLPANHENGYAHVINVPADRIGYHVILGVWDIADTENAFYQVMDVNIKNAGAKEVDTIAPSTPKDLKVSATATKVNLQWTASNDNVGVSHYIVYRNGEKLPPMKDTQLEDVGLSPNTEYKYEVVAVDKSNIESEKSKAIYVKTTKAPVVDTEAPSVPKHLHTMGQTETTIDLMWGAATDNVGIDHYQLYRNGELVNSKVSSTRIIDSGLQPNTEYTYTVKAVDAAGLVSKTSNVLKVKTKAKAKANSTTGLSTWDPTKVYNAGDSIFYNGYEYEAQYWTKGNQPDVSDPWKIKGDVVVEWHEEKAYIGGDRVRYNGGIYKAKWWTKGDVPENSIVWEIVK